MGRPPSQTPLAPHPAINPEYKLVNQYGRNTYAAEVTCPTCHTKRWYPLFSLRRRMLLETFTGKCRNCALEPARDSYWQWARENGVYRRTISKSGYVVLGPTCVSDEDLPLFRLMQNRASFVFEHRWVMAKHLGRPLESHECIDHMDGDKTNNELSNLRIYLRGKNQPGSGCGYGTYYHEWQMALVRIRELGG